MTAPRLPDPPPPSWVKPIFLGSIVAVLCYVAPYGLTAVLPASCLMLPCACGLAIVPMGAFPAWMAARQDPSLTPGQGFAVSFIASGVGGVLAALQAILGWRDVDKDDLLRAFQEQLEEEAARQQMPPDQVARIKEVFSWMIDVIPYVPIVVAAVGTVLAGLVGLVVVSGMISRRRRAAAPPESGAQS